jgi:hypothetical protein
MIGLTRLQELERQNKDLRIRLENRQNKERDKDEVIAMLQKEIGALTQKLKEACDLRAETMQGHIDAAVAAATAPLLEDLAKARLEIARLKAVIHKDSTNSSKPPRTDGFKTHNNNSREPSDRLAGGQKGHPGHRLGLPKNMDELVAKGAVKKRVVDHTDGCGEYVSRYVIDVEVVTTITEHRFAIGGQIPALLYNEVSYGDGVRAMAVLLQSEGVIAEMRLSEIIEGLTQGVVTISPATLEKFQSQFAQRLESSGELEAIKEDLLNGEIMHTDDTTMHCAQTIEYLEDGKQAVRDIKGKSTHVYVRTHSNDQSAFYTVNPKKDMDGIERDGLLPRFSGTLCHDHESKFYNYGTRHGTCGEHLARDLKGLRDLQKIPWANDMRKYVLGMNKHKNEDLAKNMDACDPALLASFEQTYDNLVERGRAELSRMRKNELGYDEFRAMLNRLANYKDCYLLFMRDYKVPFTNNLAERDLRAEKTKEKISCLFRSWQGIVNHTKIRSFISTIKKRDGDLLSAIAKVSKGIPVLR